MAKIVNFDFNPLNFDGSENPEQAYKWLRLILGSGASEKESDFLKIFSLVEKLNKNPKSLELDEGDESMVRKAIESYKHIDGLGAPRVNAYLKAQLTKAINEAKTK